MFGLFMLIIIIVLKLMKDFSEFNEERRRRTNSIKTGKDFFIDRNGSMVDVKTDTPYDYQVLEDGDKWKVHAYTRKPIENISKKNREQVDMKEKSKAIDGNKSVYMFEGYNRHEKSKIKGVRFKDINDGNIYVKRKLYQGVWLLNIQSGLFDRPDDNYIDCEFYIPGYNDNSLHTSNKIVDAMEVVDYLNKKQLQYKKTNGKPNWYNNNYINA